ncbi:hypothetical protein [Desertihabitans brevis]|uniref:hypothetical protein n=1 Tax=Desertihabitans brevis TaxID=2268447 RepID=UPI0018F46B49|nr:hypothetical protein [Desertihabitans brevis]
MMTNEQEARVRGWFAGRLPEAWRGATITVDREEVTVEVPLPDVELADASEVERDEARAGRISAWREETREQRIEIAREAEHRYERKVAWAVRMGERTERFTHLAVPVMTRLRQPQRLVLDTLVEAGVARSRSEALAWCVRLVAQHEDEWLRELRSAMTAVADVRDRGPVA